MGRRPAGFTLIEMIASIVVIGVLGVTATARYQDLTRAAADAAAQGVAREVTTGSRLNVILAMMDSAAAVSVHNGFDCSPDNLARFLSPQAWPSPDVVVANTGTSVSTCAAAGDIDSSCALAHVGGTATYPVTLTCTP